MVLPQTHVLMLEWQLERMHMQMVLTCRNGLMESNRKTLDTFFRYSHEQGLCSRTLSIEELFHPSSLHLTEL